MPNIFWGAQYKNPYLYRVFVMTGGGNYGVNRTLILTCLEKF
ncbi:MAG: hypothetical protein ACJAV6_000239 [Candidatus Paceibacteria bacterium]|jgi:hypothetical protein